MTWYAASILLAWDNIHGPQSRWHVWEDVVLFSASSHEEVMAKAVAYGNELSQLNCGERMGGTLAVQRFIGVRKILTISEDEPSDGVEVTFNEFIVESRDELEKLAKGEAARIVYEDCVRERIAPERLVYLLSQRSPDLARLYKEHMASFGEVVAHVFFDELTRWVLSLLEPETGGDAVSGARRLRDVLDVLETAFADGGEEMQEFISASFLERLPSGGEDGSKIGLMLGPRLSEQLRAIRSPRGARDAHGM